MPTCLEVFDLELRRGERTLLHQLSFRIRTGVRLGVTGPSGCGKSTLLRALLERKLPAQSHAKAFGVGRDLRLGYVPQEGGLLPWFSVGRNLSTFSMMNREGATASDELVETLGLRETLARFPDELSGGERQRVRLACALLGRPDIVLADEPLTEVALAQRWNIIEFWSQWMCVRGTALLLVSHDVATIAALCDEAIVLRGEPASPVGVCKLESPSHPRRRGDVTGDSQLRVKADELLDLAANGTSAICQ